MKKVLLILLVLAALPIVLHSTGNLHAQNMPLKVVPPTEAIALCDAGEKLIFGCKVAGGKEFSLCTSQVVNKRSGYLRYRFGVPGSLEINYPADRAKPQYFFKFSRQTRFESESQYIRFSYQDNRYEVFDEKQTVAGIDKRTSGVRNTKSGVNFYATENVCIGTPDGNLRTLENVLPSE